METWSNEIPTEDGLYWHILKTFEWLDDHWKLKEVSEPSIVYITIESLSLNVDTIGSDDPDMISFDMISKWHERMSYHYLMKAEVPKPLY